jgi:dethiobiotin synthetase
MNRNFLITGTGPGVGKSIVGCALGFAFRARGLRVGVMKPVETGCAIRNEELDAADTRALALASGCALPMEVLCPYRYRSRLPAIAAAKAESTTPPDLARIKDCFARIASASDIVLVEGGGSLPEHLTDRTDFADLAADVSLDLIMVIANRVGCIDSALAGFHHAASKGVRVAGWILNDVEPGVAPDLASNAASLSRLTEATCLGTMRFKEPLGIGVVNQLLEHRNRQDGCVKP